MKQLSFFIFLVLTTLQSRAIQYPYPVHYFQLHIEGKPYRMAYMDVAPAQPNGKTVILFHGKNFNGYYWKDVIPALANQGFRVVVPDQVGWGMSDKPALHYSFSLLANNTKKLLDSLGIKAVNVVGHSMGGMLATRFVVMHPEVVSKLILENPIGLEDYGLFVPYQPLEKLYEKEKESTFESMKKYQQTYYPQWKPEYEQYVQAQYDATTTGNPDTNAMAAAITYQMILNQPVIQYFDKIQVPTLLIIGQEDRTVVGKNLLSPAQKQQHGQYPALGRNAKKLLPNATLVELPGVGHIPHIQSLLKYLEALQKFLAE